MDEVFELVNRGPSNANVIPDQEDDPALYPLLSSIELGGTLIQAGRLVDMWPQLNTKPSRPPVRHPLGGSIRSNGRCCCGAYWIFPMFEEARKVVSRYGAESDSESV